MVSVRIERYEIRHGNARLFIRDRFLLLPASEIEFIDDGCWATEEALGEALDITPDLPPRVLASAWRNHIVFWTEMKTSWAMGVARSLEIGANEIVQAFQEVRIA